MFSHNKVSTSTHPTDLVYKDAITRLRHCAIPERKKNVFYLTKKSSIIDTVGM